MENKTKIIMSLLGVLLVVASSGATFVLNDTGKNLRCSNSWSFIDSGEFEGQYSCSSNSGVRYSYCASVRDTASGRLNYWCDEAVPVLVEVPVVVDPVLDNSVRKGSYDCYVGGCEI